MFLTAQKKNEQKTTTTKKNKGNKSKRFVET